MPISSEITISDQDYKNSYNPEIFFFTWEKKLGFQAGISMGWVNT